ncbi:Scramblase-domain-containing protein [Scleroderma citrinum]
MLATPVPLRTSLASFRTLLGPICQKNLLVQPRQSHSQTRIWHQPQRRYAHSRFPDKRTGFGRVSAASRRFQKEPGSSKYNDSFKGPTSANSESEPWSSVIPPQSSDDPEVALTQLLANDVLVVTRQLEMLNIFVGFEQSNRYVISNVAGEALGYIVEEPRGLLSMFSRQFFRTHRPFRALVMDLDGSPILWVRGHYGRGKDPSPICVDKFPHDSQSPMLHVEQSLDTFAEVQQEWHPWRRKYNMFLKAAPIRVLTPTSESELQPKGALEPHFKQFARIDEGLWAWHFVVRDADGDGMATISRAFRGFGREIFTDTGQYVVTFGGEDEPVLPTPGQPLRAPHEDKVKDLTLDIDYDYFSRHSDG